MDINKAFETISKKIAEVDKQKADILQRLETNKSEKARGESIKLAALESKDEAVYKSACKIISDADAGIEFNTICLGELQKEKFATETEDAEVKRGLFQGLKEIYCEAIKELEKANNEILRITEDALQKIIKIDSMEDKWKKTIMKSNDTGVFSHDRKLIMSSRNNGAKAELNCIKNIMKNDQLFKDGK